MVVRGRSRSAPARELAEELLDRPEVEGTGEAQNGAQCWVALASFESRHDSRRQPAEPDEHVLAYTTLPAELDNAWANGLQARFNGCLNTLHFRRALAQCRRRRACGVIEE